MDPGSLLVFYLAAGCICGGIGSYVARAKGRLAVEGLLFGFLLGPIGVLIEVLMPTVSRPAARPSAPDGKLWRFKPRPSPWSGPAEKPADWADPGAMPGQWADGPGWDEAGRG